MDEQPTAEIHNEISKLSKRLADLERHLESTDQHLADASKQFEYLSTKVDELAQVSHNRHTKLQGDVDWIRGRLATLLPEPNNCTKCGRKLIKASRKCACGFQN